MKTLAKAALVFVVLFLALIFIGGISRLTYLIITKIPFGWMAFLKRTIPEAELNWSGIGMVILSSALIIAALHFLAKWIYSTVASQKVWSWRWTARLYASFWLLFCIIMGAAGLSGHLRWLYAFEGRLYTERLNTYLELRIPTSLIQFLMNGEGATPENFRDEYLMSDQEFRGDQFTWEKNHLVLLTGTNGLVHSAIIIPRDLRIQQYGGFAVVTKNQDSGQFPMVKLNQFLSSSEAEIASLVHPDTPPPPSPVR